MIEFLSDGIWERLVKLSGKCGTKKVIVPYFSTSDPLKFKEGDTLIVNASDYAVKTGQTDAKCIEEAYSNNCSVYSNASIHAKVYLFDGAVIAGSNNLSRNSQQHLIESAILTDDPLAVSGAYQMVARIEKESTRVDQKFIKRILKLPVERRVKSRFSNVKKIKITKPRFWIVFGGYEDEHPGDKKHAEMMNSKLLDTLSEDMQKDRCLEPLFWWGNNSFSRKAVEGDYLIYIQKPTYRYEHTRNVLVYKPALIYKIDEDGARKGLKNYYCLWEKNADDTCLSWSAFMKAVKKEGFTNNFHVNMCRQLDYNKSVDLLQNWNTYKDRYI